MHQLRSESDSASARDPDAPGWSFERICLTGMAFIALTIVSVILLLPAVDGGLITISPRTVLVAAVMGGVAVALIARMPTQ